MEYMCPQIALCKSTTTRLHDQAIDCFARHRPWPGGGGHGVYERAAVRLPLGLARHGYYLYVANRANDLMHRMDLSTKVG